MGGLRGKKKWRSGRNGTPEGWLRRGRGSHTCRYPQGLGSGESMPSTSPAQSAREVCLAIGLGPITQKLPLGHVGPGGIGGRIGENRRSRQEGSSGARGAGEKKGVCPAHLSMGKLLSAQADPLPSKAHSGPRGSWGHRREMGGVGENRRGRWEGPSRTGGAGEEWRALAPPTRSQEACWATRTGPPPSKEHTPMGPGGIGGRLGESRRGRWEGPSATRGAEKGVGPSHLGPGSLLGSQVGSTALGDQRWEAHLGPFC